MKKISFILLALGLLIGLAPSNISALAPTISVSVYFGSQNITEEPLRENGYPASPSYIKFTSSDPATAGTKITISTSSNCLLSVEGKGGGVYGQTFTDPYNNFTTMTSMGVSAVDDSVYEGTHSCTVTGTLVSPDATFNGVSGSITFTITDNEPAPAPAPAPTPTVKPTSKPTPTSAPAVEETIKPEVPQAKLVDTEGNELKPAEGEEKVSFDAKEPIVLSGVTIPNGVVKLYIFSEPQEATVTADETGAWSYTVESIEPGDHRVEVEVTDPATGQTSARQQVLAFAVAQADDDNLVVEDSLTTTPVTKEDSDHSTLFLLLIGGGVILAGTAGGAFWWIKRRRKLVTTNTNTTSPIPPTEDTHR